MTLKVAIHQPQYWPWPRYIHKVLSADVFVYLDTVQFSKNGMQNRNQVKSTQGPAWISLPIRHRLGQSLLETRLADVHVAEKHWHTICASYARTEGFRLWKEELRQLLLGTPTDLLCDRAIATTEWLLQKLAVTARRVRASELPAVDATGSRLVAGLCAFLDGEAYLTGTGGLEYMEREHFVQAGCEVWEQSWAGLIYEQVFPESGFAPDLSTLDLVLTHPRDARQLIEGAGSWKRLWGQP